MRPRPVRLALALAAVFVAGPAFAQPTTEYPMPYSAAPTRPPAPRSFPRGNGAIAPNPAAAEAAQRAAIGDVAGGRKIPVIVLRILADPRIDPIVAYLLWQAARSPIGDWTVAQYLEITHVVPTLIETGISTLELELLYKYLGLDPNRLFQPQLATNWQTTSTAFDPRLNVAAISSAECQMPPGQMTIAAYQTCLKMTQ
jgi:hypothetical protein